MTPFLVPILVDSKRMSKQVTHVEFVTSIVLYIARDSHGIGKDRAPKTCENFVGLINKGFYDGICFHRIISVVHSASLSRIELYDPGR